MSSPLPAPDPGERRPGGSPAGPAVDPAPPRERIPAIPRAPDRRDALRTPDGIERLFRSRSGVLGGVATGLAAHLRLRVLWIRLAFAVLGVLGGAGIAFYALLWIFVPPQPLGTAAPSPAHDRSDKRQAISVALVGAVLLVVGGSFGLSSTLGWILGPLGVVAVGAAFIWREADDTRRARWRRSAAGMSTPRAGTWWRLVSGALLVVGGLAFFAIGQFQFSAMGPALAAVLLTLIGVGVISIPWWVRLVRALGDERSERVAAAERAEIAAHLHDSVLQTLALIQRQAGDAREVARLARGQERELRTWLYGPAGYAGSGQHPTTGDEQLALALQTAAGDVEDTYAVKVAPVVVGDAPMSPALAALVAAAREAMVNAAKHAGVAEISVFGDVEDGTATVFVRDRGRGFDPAAVASDRRGLAESVRGRIERHGGSARVTSSPGAGTEVELRMPLAATPVDLRKQTR